MLCHLFIVPLLFAKETLVSSLHIYISISNQTTPIKVGVV